MDPHLTYLHRRLRGDSGFTLIELLVVMIIIAILMAVAVPSYLHQKRMAVRTQLLTNIHFIEQAVDGCSADNADGSYKGCTEHTYIQAFEPSLNNLPICCPVSPPPPGAFDVNGIAFDDSPIWVTPPTMAIQGWEVDAWMPEGSHDVWFQLAKWPDGNVTRKCGIGMRPTFTKTPEPGIPDSMVCKTGKW